MIGRSNHLHLLRQWSKLDSTHWIHSLHSSTQRQIYIPLAMDMAKVGGPLPVVKACTSHAMCKNMVSESGWSVAKVFTLIWTSFEHSKSTPYYFSLPLVFSVTHVLPHRVNHDSLCDWLDQTLYSYIQSKHIKLPKSRSVVPVPKMLFLWTKWFPKRHSQNKWLVVGIQIYVVPLWWLERSHCSIWRHVLMPYQCVLKAHLGPNKAKKWSQGNIKYKIY